MVWINFEDTVQVILFEHRQRLVLASCGPRGGGGGRGGRRGRRGGVRGGALVCELSGARDAGRGEAHPGCARSVGAVELRVIIMIMIMIIMMIVLMIYCARVCM